MNWLARLLVILAALSFIIGIILKLMGTVFPVRELPAGAFLRFADTSLLFAIALLVLIIAGTKARA